MIEAVETATGFILLAVLAVALYHQWRRGKSVQAQLAAAEAALEQLQRACSRLAPAGVVQRLVADGIQSNTGLVAERKVATAMFVDLVGFSAMSERLDPRTARQWARRAETCRSRVGDYGFGDVAIAQSVGDRGVD